ncbi:hypothetical protein R1sor_020176 [Riccia sorocarpa]|uniref:Uncharacterized protein n=1 Tax=Riccia sorocarpa TaxID=122646 RepID=A0ABD3IKW4_9MARC
MELSKKMVLLLVAMLLALSDAQNTEEKTIICNGDNLPNYDYQQAVLNTLGDVIYNTWDTGLRWKKVTLQDCRLRYEIYDFDFVTYGADAHDEQPGPNDIVIAMEVA